MVRVDAKGRITIPQEIREALDLEPGEEVNVDLEDDEVVIHPRVDRETFLSEMAGCVNAETRRRDVEPIDPLDLKRDWTSDLPG